jgi:hypothetical protein
MRKSGGGSKSSFGQRSTSGQRQSGMGMQLWRPCAKHERILSCSISVIIIQAQAKAKRPSKKATTTTGTTPWIRAGRGAGGHFFSSSGGVL